MQRVLGDDSMRKCRPGKSVTFGPLLPGSLSKLGVRLARWVPTREVIYRIYTAKAGIEPSRHYVGTEVATRVKP